MHKKKAKTRTLLTIQRGVVQPESKGDEVDKSLKGVSTSITVSVSAPKLSTAIFYCHFPFSLWLNNTIEKHHIDVLTFLFHFLVQWLKMTQISPTLQKRCKKDFISIMAIKEYILL